MKFTPTTEKAIQEANLIAKDSICDFEVLEATDKTSKAGNEMIELKLKVYKPDGEGYLVINDYLLESMQFKLIHAAGATGNSEQYNKGLLTADDFAGKTGRCKIGVQKGGPKDDGSDENYPDKNVIKDYINKGVAVAVDLDDEIPFATNKK